MRDKLQEVKSKVRKTMITSIEEVLDGESYLRIGVYPTQPGQMYICPPVIFIGKPYKKEKSENTYIHAKHISSNTYFICLNSWNADVENPTSGQGRLFRYTDELFEILTTIVQNNDIQRYLELIK